MSVRRRLLAGTALASVALLATAAPRVRPSPSLRLGIVPYLSARQIVVAFEPLRAHLAQALGLSVTTYTAPSFRAFARALDDGDYDLAFAPPHLSRLAAQDWGWRPLARTQVPAQVMLVQRAGDVPPLPAGLRGGRVVVVDSISLAALACADWLASSGLRTGSEVALDYLSDAPSLMLALSRPEVTAMAMMSGHYADLAPDARAWTQPATVIASLPAPGYIGSPQLSPQLRAALAEALLAFAPDGSGGSLSRSRLLATTLADTAAVERFTQLARDGLSQRGRRNA
jgi:phosphonate transport system substrate-binding protein